MPKGKLPIAAGIPGFPFKNRRFHGNYITEMCSDKQFRFQGYAKATNPGLGRTQARALVCAMVLSKAQKGAVVLYIIIGLCLLQT